MEPVFLSKKGTRGNILPQLSKGYNCWNRGSYEGLVLLLFPPGGLQPGEKMAKAELPENAALAAIVRDGRVITAKAHDVFAAGDELLFVASADAEAQIKACFIS